MKKYAIIVAGGSGTRMGAEIPKQFLLLNGTPILMHTINAFASLKYPVKIILVLPENSIEEWNSLCEKHEFKNPVILTVGGSSRFQSVKNGLDKIENHHSLVAIHDGVRPLVTEKMITDSFELAADQGTAIAATPLKETIRQLAGDISRTIDRDKLRSIQTPQTFQTGLIKKAFDRFDKDENFTDDASVAEKAGFQIHLFEGDYQNIKITTPEDLLFASAIISQQKRR